MADIVLGMATSHGPLLSTPPEEWHQRAEADRRHPALCYRGETYTFAQLLAARGGPRFEQECALERRQARHAACQRHLATLAAVLRGVAPDVAVIIGDDQDEVFHDDNLPALAVYWGETIPNLPIPAERLAAMPPGVAIAAWGHAPPEPRHYPGAPALGRHLIEALIAEGFDVAHSRRLPVGPHGSGSISHAHGFVYRRLFHDAPVPSVPVFINTYYPPNQPSVARCYAFGEALGRAIARWPARERVAVIASGGLSHFVIEEEFDRALLEALARKDAAALTALPDRWFQSGTSESKNWIALAGVLADTPLRMTLVDYVPCYRSEAGTGAAMGFAYWSE
jgi:hypothetical protein